MTNAGITKFARFQIASLAATSVDFGVTILLKELCGLHYLPSTSIGTLSGGVTNFIMCRNWVFRNARHSAIKQASRYLMIWAGSILLNILFVYLFTSLIGLNYIISKVITAIFIGITFNYSLQNKFVFVEYKPDGSTKNIRS